MSRRFGLAILLLAVSVVLTAQQADDTPPSSDATESALPADVQDSLRSKAFGLEQQPKSEMLAEFARMLRDDVLEPTDPIVEECVGHVATESWATPVRRAGRAANDFPAVRARAARLLGDVGTPAAHAILYSILRHDTDNTVRGEAALAIARIAVVDRQPTIDLFAYLLSSMATTARPDNAFTYALVRAVRIMIDTSGPIADPDLYTAMVAVAQGPYSGTIRDMAVDTLVSMRESSTN